MCSRGFSLASADIKSYISFSVFHFRLNVLFLLLFAIGVFERQMLCKLSGFTFSGGSLGAPGTCSLRLTGVTGETLLPTKSCVAKEMPPCAPDFPQENYMRKQFKKNMLFFRGREIRSQFCQLPCDLRNYNLHNVGMTFCIMMHDYPFTEIGSNSLQTSPHAYIPAIPLAVDLTCKSHGM